MIFQFVLLTLAAYRLQRIVTTDDWPPSVALRTHTSGYLHEFLTCPWCFGTWLTFAVFTVAAQILVVPLPVLQALAAAAIVGQIGQHD